ncbi:CDP-diacylglycerol--glycerol-3-phosphate 3-phosphatidyltransferase 1, chloroplastic-like protein [Drosera capensis]
MAVVWAAGRTVGRSGGWPVVWTDDKRRLSCGWLAVGCGWSCGPPVSRPVGWPVGGLDYGRWAVVPAVRRGGESRSQVRKSTSTNCFQRSGRGKFAAAATRFVSPPSNSSLSLAASSSSSTGGPDTMGCSESSTNGDVVEQGVSLSSSSSRGEKGEVKLLTLPTILTLGRVAAIPIFISTYYVNSWWGTAATTSIFIAAAITDWLDGYIARKMRLGTAFGAFLDPVADKLMVAATLVLLCSRPSEAAMFRDMPWLLPVPAILIIGREVTVLTITCICLCVCYLH